jgi:hypothetical protein
MPVVCLRLCASSQEEAQTVAESRNQSQKVANSRKEPQPANYSNPKPKNKLKISENKRETSFFLHILLKHQEQSHKNSDKV